MNVLWLTAALVGVTAAAAYSQRGDNWRARAHYWHQATETQTRLIARRDAHIRRLETALGRRPTEHWLPARHTPPIRAQAPTDAELALWLTATDAAPAPYQRYPYAEYQPTDDRVRHRKPRRITTDEIRAVVGAA